MKRLLNISLFLSLVLGLTSCLKDENIIGPDAPGAIRNVVEFKNPAVPSSSTSDVMPFYVLSYDIMPSVDMNITVSYSGADPAPNDLTVKLALDDAAIETANDEQDLNMIPLPTSMYSIPALNVTIPKGQRTGTLKVTLKTDQFDLSKAYALGFKITGVEGTSAPVSGNFGTIVVSVGAKNKFDGRYDVTGECIDANGSYKGFYPTSVDLISAGANAVVYYNHDFDYPNYIVINKSSGGAANTGIRPKFTIDLTTGDVTAINNLATGADIKVSGKYNLATKEMDIEWKLGRWSVKEHYKYTGPR